MLNNAKAEEREAPLRALIVEDSEDDALLLVASLRRGGVELQFERVTTASEMIAALAKGRWDIVFSDHTLRQFTGMEALTLVRERKPEASFIFVSGATGEENAVAAIKAGADDYVLKGNLRRIPPVVQRAVREAPTRLEKKRKEERVQYLAHHDLLTDLPNRTLFYDRMQQGILTCNREKKPLALLLIDLDRFKEVNDTFGHYCGDLLLRQIGPRLRSALRESDTIGRMGGDEFAILLPNTHVEGAGLIARKILKLLKTRFVLKEAEVEVGASIGIAFYPDHGKECPILFQRADRAMYVTKQGGGGYAFYMQTAHGEPTMKSAEPISRWDPSHLGFAPLDPFIPPVEQSGERLRFTRWIPKAVSARYAAWRKRLESSDPELARDEAKEEPPSRSGQGFHAGGQDRARRPGA